MLCRHWRVCGYWTNAIVRGHLSSPRLAIGRLHGADTQSTDDAAASLQDAPSIAELLRHLQVQLILALHAKSAVWKHKTNSVKSDRGHVVVEEKEADDAIYV